jgi:intein-encoded DNA endonuclease-like protein
MEYNRELEKIDTQEKAYLLGFMYGDGTISNYVEKNNRIRFLTRISIHKDDENLIYSLHENFPFFNLGEYDFSKHNKNSGKQKSLAKSSKELYHDLLNNGVYPRKSYENKEMLKIPDINENLISHFIRGFFDADGSIYIRAKRKNLITIEFCSVSKTFIYELDSYLKSIDINCWNINEKLPRGKSKQIVYQLVFIKTSEILKLIDFIYKDANISLQRKKDKCLNYKPVDKVIDRNMICKYCGSNHIVKDGKRGNSIRYECKGCGKKLSIRNDGSVDGRIKY